MYTCSSLLNQLNFNVFLTGSFITFPFLFNEKRPSFSSLSWHSAGTFDTSIFDRTVLFDQAKFSFSPPYFFRFPARAFCEPAAYFKYIVFSSAYGEPGSPKENDEVFKALALSLALPDRRVAA
jgi:hypothetical protein